MDFFSIAPFKQHKANHTIKFVRKVVHGLNALQSQKITKQNTPKLGKNGKKKTAKNTGPKRSKDPKYLNVITERAAPKGKSATRRRFHSNGRTKGFAQTQNLQLSQHKLMYSVFLQPLTDRQK